MAALDAQVRRMAKQGFLRRTIATETGLTHKEISAIINGDKTKHRKKSGRTKRAKVRTKKPGGKWAKHRKKLIDAGCDPKVIEANFGRGK